MNSGLSFGWSGIVVQLQLPKSLALAWSDATEKILCLLAPAILNTKKGSRVGLTIQCLSAHLIPPLPIMVPLLSTVPGVSQPKMFPYTFFR